MERAACFGGQGSPTFLDVATTLSTHGFSSVKVVNYIYGLGGRDTVPAEFCKVYEDLLKIADTGVAEPVFRYLGLRD
jgi:pyruvate ferredoxin oxidoreductase alpha subunit